MIVPLDDGQSGCFKIVAHKLYDGLVDNPLVNQVVEIDKGLIQAVRPATNAELADPALLSAKVLAPGFIDIQINGANDTQFNFDPSAEALGRIAEGARKGGTAYVLPTFITAPGQAYSAALTAGRHALEQEMPGILGVHLEGPFLSPERPGIHDQSAIRAMAQEDLALLVAPFPGVLLVTLAPECQPAGMVSALSEAGVIVFVGHSAAEAKAVAQAETEGLKGATHLFNAMSQMNVREPGVVGGVLASENLFAGLIADGHHVAWPNVQIAVRLLGDRLCLVTDAMLTLAGQQTSFELNGEQIHLENGCLTNAEGRLAGAHVAMDECVQNVVTHAGVSHAEALRMASTNPARCLGLEGELGAIRVGYRASMTLLDDDLHTQAVIVDGLTFN